MFAANKLLTELVKNFELIGEKESQQIKASVHFLLDSSGDSETKGSCLNWDVEKKIK